MLEVSALSVRYGKLDAVRQVSLEVEPGEIVGLLGHNGAGKSSLLHALMGLIPSAGNVSMDGKPVARAVSSKAYDAGLRLVPQSGRYFPRLTVTDNLELAATGIRDAPMDRDLLAFVYDLFPRLRDRQAQLAGTLSGGEGQMLAVSMGIMSRPTVLMLDEPSVGLAPVFVERLMSAIERVRDEMRVSVLLVEQNVAHALNIVDRVYVLRSGSVQLVDQSGNVSVESLWKAF